MRRQISAGVDGGLSGGSSVRRPGSKDPHLHKQKFCYNFSIAISFRISIVSNNLLWDPYIKYSYSLRFHFAPATAIYTMFLGPPFKSLNNLGFSSNFDIDIIFLSLFLIVPYVYPKFGYGKPKHNTLRA